MGTGYAMLCGTGLLKSQPHYRADYQVVTFEAILASHEAMHLVMVS